jgi:prepilin-type processing-associated H-X9-DG protein
MARRDASDANEFDSSIVLNGKRSWFAYQGPLRVYEPGLPFASQPCTDIDVVSNAWDLWGDGWNGNNSINTNLPVFRQSPNNSPTFFKDSENKVIAYCPNMVRVDGPTSWWHDWRAPHLTQPGWNDTVTTAPIHDARNYLFTDGHAISIVY